MHESGEYAPSKSEILGKNALMELDSCKRRSIETVRDVGNVPVIENIETAAAWHVTLSDVRSRKKMAIEVIEKIRKPAYDAYQAVLNFKKEIVGPLEEIEKQIAARLSQFKTEEDRRQKEERDRVLKEIEEAQRQQMEAEAMMLEAEGDTAAAEAVRKAPVAFRPEELDSFRDPENQQEGEYKLRYRDNWKAEVVDFPMLIRAVLDGKVPADVLQPNMTRLNQMARALNESAQIPGVIVRNEPVPLGN